MPADYEIDATTPTQALTASGGTRDVMEVSFHTIPDELTGSVRVPLTGNWNAAATAAIVALIPQLRALAGAP